MTSRLSGRRKAALFSWSIGRSSQLWLPLQRCSLLQPSQPCAGSVAAAAACLCGLPRRQQATGGSLSARRQRCTKPLPFRPSDHLTLPALQGRRLPPRQSTHLVQLFLQLGSLSACPDLFLRASSAQRKCTAHAQRLPSCRSGCRRQLPGRQPLRPMPLSCSRIARRQQEPADICSPHSCVPTQYMAAWLCSLLRLQPVP